MIYEVITSDFRNKCGNCIYFKTVNGIDGKCICKDNKVKIRIRSYNSKSCTYKCTKR